MIESLPDHESPSSSVRVPDRRNAAWPAGYRIEVDSVDAFRWSEVVALFADASIYQTWPYEAERSGRRAMSHFILRKDDEIVAAAQLRIAKVPLLPLGAAYARWGPMWRLRGRSADPEVLRLALRGLLREYADKRGLSVRLLPLAFDSERASVEPLLAAEGFEHNALEGVQRTLLVSLEPPLADLRKGLEQKWRNCLNRAEKNDLEIRSGTDDELFAMFAGLYDQMHRRKGFQESSDVNEFRRMQAALPQASKLRIAVALSEGKPAAGMVCAGVGEMGVYLYGATGDAGMSTKASYLLQWQVLAWLKESGARSYNLHGINPDTNPGTYHFKAGLCGKNGQDLRYLGVYEAATSPVTRGLIRLANSVRRLIRNTRTAIHKRGAATGGTA